MAYEPTLTVYTDANPMPRLEVLFSSFDPDTEFVTVYRFAGGREFKVRGAVMAPTVGSLTRIDSEVPFGVPASYRAEMFDGSGQSLGFTGTDEVTVDVNETWVHNPIDPAGGVRVILSNSAARELSRPVDGEVFYPQGRHVAVVISGQRRGYQGVVLDCVTTTSEEADKFADLVGTYATTTVPVLCFRFSADSVVRLPRPLYVAVFDPRERAPQENGWSERYGSDAVEWGVIGDEASPPAAGIVIPLLTRADINAYYATNADIASDNLTRLDVNRRYDLAGTAG
jgi:hypothetical protein